jgi:hypothetical protein
MCSIRINYKEYPEFMFAMIAAYLPETEGYELRRIAGNVAFKHEDSYGATYKNGTRHSFDDLPAIKIKGYCAWYKNGRLHREGDKPAVIKGKNTDIPENCIQEWWVNGRLHREGDKPAHINENREEWWMNGFIYREGDRPSIITGDKHEWWSGGNLHREGGRPAVLNVRTNYKEWYIHGNRQNPPSGWCVLS